VKLRFVGVDEGMPAVPITFAVSNAAPDLLRELDQALIPVMAGADFVAAKDRWFGAQPPYRTRLRILIWGGLAFAALSSAMLVSLIRIRVQDRRRRLAEAIRYAAELAAANLDPERKDDEMRRLIYVVSHDLNSPLASIGGFVRRLSRGMDNGDSAERIGRKTMTMRRLLDGVLVRNRASSETIQIDALSPQLLVRNVREALSSPLADAGAGLEVEIDAPMLSCDPLPITQSVQNLVENALKHGCPVPGMTVRLRIVHCPGGVRIEVSDRGPGVPQDRREEVFRPFIRGPGARQAGKAGLEIGLATVRAVMEKHHGRLWVEHREGGGARFVMELPADQPAPAALVKEIA
jgi:signal transduction histidine kinase